jgi:hypothetical protein
MDKLGFKIGDTIAWPWLSGAAEGIVKDIIPEKTSIVSKGSIITRNGTPQNPAIIISHKSGNDVLKLASEVRII